MFVCLWFRLFACVKCFVCNFVWFGLCRVCCVCFLYVVLLFVVVCCLLAVGMCLFVRAPFVIAGCLAVVLL